MKRLFALLLFVILGLFPLRADSNRLVFYISVSGNDAWSGKLSAPNAQKSDGPFATLERARNAVRATKTNGLRAPVTVFVRGGVYPVTQTLRFDSTDSGTAASPIVWSGFNDETVRLVGGRVVKGFTAVADQEVLARFPAEVRGKVLVADLKRQGITDYGTIPNGMDLYYKGNRMTIARFPNKGWLSIASVPQTGDSLINAGDKKVIRDGQPGGRHFGRFTYSGTRPDSWKQSGEIWMHGYFAWDWRDAYQKVARIDAATQTIYPVSPHHYYGYIKGQRYYFLNVLEELDAPGEWFVDTRNGLLYFLPPGSLEEGDVMISTLNEPMITIDNASYLTMQKFTFECSRTTVVKMIRGIRNRLAGCVVRDIGNEPAVIIDGGSANCVQSCDVYDVGAHGIKISGGERKTLTPGSHIVMNNHIHGYGQITQAFSGAVWCEGVSNTISHNRIHDAPFSGIQFYGNEHVIEFNEVFDVAHESGDVGGANTGGDYSDQGTTIRYNYFHDAHAGGVGEFRAVYLDLPGSNTTIFGNVFRNVDIGVFFNSGRDNLVQNNIFVNCHPSVGIYIWPHKQYFEPGGPWRLVEKLGEINYKNPPYSTRYPKLPNYLDQPEKGLPYGNKVINNVSYGGTWLDLSEELGLEHAIVEKNLITDSVVMVLTKKWTPDYDPYNIGYAAVYRFGDKKITGEFEQRGNVLMNKDPGFVDLKRGNLQLRDNSPAFKMGFRRIPMEQIGLMVDEFRKLGARDANTTPTGF
jgi:hypothetical protein